MCSLWCPDGLDDFGGCAAFHREAILEMLDETLDEFTPETLLAHGPALVSDLELAVEWLLKEAA